MRIEAPRRRPDRGAAVLRTVRDQGRYIYIYIYIHIMYIYIYREREREIDMHISISISLYIYIYIYMYVCMCIYTCYICIHIYIYIYIYNGICLRTGELLPLRLWRRGGARRKTQHIDFRTLYALRCPDLTDLILSQTPDWKLPESYERKRL